MCTSLLLKQGVLTLTIVVCYFFCVTREICFYFSSDCSYNFRPFGVIAVIMRTKQKVRAKEYVDEDGLLLLQNK